MRHFATRPKFYKLSSVHCQRSLVSRLSYRLPTFLPLSGLYIIHALPRPTQRGTRFQHTRYLCPFPAPAPQTHCIILVSRLHRLLACHAVFSTPRPTSSTRHRIWHIFTRVIYCIRILEVGLSLHTPCL